MTAAKPGGQTRSRRNQRGWLTMRDERRTDSLLPAHGSPAFLRVPKVYRALSRRCAPSGLLLPRPVFGDGLCSADLPRESPRHRSLPGFYARQVVPHGLPGTRDALDTGRRQRGARLAHLCRLRPCADCHGTTAVCRRSARRGPRSSAICAEFDNHRSLSFGISVGQVPQAQGRGEDAHPARPARRRRSGSSISIRSRTATCVSTAA